MLVPIHSSSVFAVEPTTPDCWRYWPSVVNHCEECFACFSACRDYMVHPPLAVRWTNTVSVSTYARITPLFAIAYLCCHSILVFFQQPALFGCCPRLTNCLHLRLHFRLHLHLHLHLHLRLHLRPPLMPTRWTTAAAR